MKTKGKTLFMTLITLMLMLIIAFQPITLNASPESTINGIKWTSTNGQTIDAHGGGIIQVGNYYYWFGERRSDGGYLFDAVTCYRSQDLVNWEYRNDVLTPSAHPDLNPCNIERPKVVYNASTGKYVMWMHWENGQHYGEAKCAVAYCDTVDGDYTFVKAFRPYEDEGIIDHGRPGYMSRDCTLFVDNDGTAYFISSSNENADMHIYELTDDYLDIDHLVTKLWEGQKREAPALVKKGDYYFLLTSGCTGWSPNQAKYAYSTSLTSGWSSLINVGDNKTFYSQPTYIITVQGSAGTSYLYLGDRWSGAWGLSPNNSTYIMLPLTISGHSMSMNWVNTVSVDASAGTVSGTNNRFYITSKASSKVLDASGTSEGDNIAIWDNWGGNNQKWILSYDGNGYFRLQNLASNYVADVSGGSTANNANVIQWSNNGGDNQKWSILPVGNGEYKLINKKSGKALDVAGVTNGSNVQQYSWYGGNNQIWSITY